MRIGCLQFAPHVGDVDNNLNRADAILNKSNADDLDLLVLPEMAFSGYNFSSLQQISPFLEPTGAGITSVWARTTALKHNCKVLVGYPEKSDVSRKFYNSAIMVNEDGETCGHYRKSHLYYTDKTWAHEGDGFFADTIPGLGKVAMGICMDINPYDFVADEALCEFATHAVRVRADLVIVSMAWLTQGDPSFYCLPKEPDMETVSYWVRRLEPLIRAETEDEIVVIFANRTGTEGDAVYAGTSAVFGIQRGVVTVYGWLGRAAKELLIVDTEKPGIGRLVYRPEGETDKADKADKAPRRESDHPTGSDSVGPMASGPSSSPAGSAPDQPQIVDNSKPSDTSGTIVEHYRPVSTKSRTVGVTSHDTGRSQSRRGRPGEEARMNQALEGRHRHQSEPGDFQRRQKENQLASRHENAGRDARDTSAIRLPLSRAGSFTPDLEKIGADLMVFEEEWASRRRRDSLVCHVDEDDYVVLRKDTIPIKKQPALREPDPRGSPRRAVPHQETRHRSKVRSRSASRNVVAPVVLGSDVYEDNHPSHQSRLRGRSDSAPAPKPETRKGQHGLTDSRDQSPKIRGSRQTHTRTGSSAAAREVQFPGETSPPWRRQRQAETSLNAERATKQSPKPDIVTLPVRSKLPNGEVSQHYSEGLPTLVDRQTRSPPRPLNPIASRQEPKAMVLPSEYDPSTGYRITIAGPG